MRIQNALSDFDDVEVLHTGDLFHYNSRRWFGPYTELMELNRVGYENQTQNTLRLRPSHPIGEPTITKAGLSFGDYRIVTCHPIDYVWILIGSNIFLADRVVQYYIRWATEHAARSAEKRIDQMTDRFSIPDYRDTDRVDATLFSLATHPIYQGG